MNIYFNTSHVTVYRLSIRRYSPVSNDFNTSHVTVYRIVMLPQADVLNFNTSHVTVYPAG